MSAEADLDHCRAAIKTGSRSFYAASHLLPRQVCDDALALYAFCRLADDAVDLGGDKAAAVLRLRDRLEAAYAGSPFDQPADRAFARMVERVEMPRTLPEALIEGLAWDAQGREYETLSGVRDYSARVAAAVGAMMTVLMGVRDPQALARACDMGVAMQLTNIARDVGEDARMGRIYLPHEWLRQEGVDEKSLRADPTHSRGLARCTARLLSEARRLYMRSESGISRLPARCRPAIYACREIYAAIGDEVSRNGHNSVDQRAHTSGWLKLRLGTRALFRAGVSTVTPQEATLYAPALGEVQYLVDAASRSDGAQSPDRLERFLNVLQELEEQEPSRALV